MSPPRTVWSVHQLPFPLDVCRLRLTDHTIPRLPADLVAVLSELIAFIGYSESAFPLSKR